MVWSVTLGWTAAPSTVAPVIVIPPRRAAIVLSSRRSMAAPDVLRTAIVSLTPNARVAKLRRTVASYSAVTFIEVALTAPGRIASVAPALGAAATGDEARWRSPTAAARRRTRRVPRARGAGVREPRSSHRG